MDSVNNAFRKILLFISLLCAILLLVGGFVFLQQFDLLSNQPDEEPEVRTEEEQRVIEELPDNLVYNLPRDATPLQLALFTELFNFHEQYTQTPSAANALRYASVIAQNFVADFFTLSNKSARINIGGLQFITPDILDAFQETALNNFYFHLNHHINTFGQDLLPTVETTRIINAEAAQHSLALNESPWSEYIPVIVVDIEWTYLQTTFAYLAEFQTSARIILQENNDTIRIVAITEMPMQANETYEED